MVIGIIGLGLMGGSLAKSLRNNHQCYNSKQENIVDKVIGYDRNPHHSNQACTLDFCDDIVDFDTIKTSDIIILTIPIQGIITTLKRLQDIPAKTTIIDFGSTKKSIINSIPPTIRANFVAAHPMAGTEKSGPLAAIDNLYSHKTVIICDQQNSGKQHVQKAQQLFNVLQMHIVYMQSDLHDKHTAFISHLPHVTSFALANMVLKQEDPASIAALGGTSFADVCRIAKSDAQMWQQVFMDNKDYLKNSLTTYLSEISQFIDYLDSGNVKAIDDWIKQANALKHIL